MKRQAWLFSTALITLLAGCTQPPAMVEYKGDQFYGRSTAMLDRSSAVSYGSYSDEQPQDNNTYQAVGLRSVDVAPLHSQTSSSVMPVSVTSQDLAAPMQPVAQPAAQPQPFLKPLNSFGTPVSTPSAAPRYRPVANPAGQVHRLEKGETLYRLSKKYDVPVEAIRQANAMNDYTVQVGQQLAIPAKEVSATQLAAIAPASAPVPVKIPVVAPAPVAVAKAVPVVKAPPTVASVTPPATAKAPAAVASAAPSTPKAPAADMPVPQFTAPATQQSAPVPEVRQVALKTTTAPVAAQKFIWPVQGKVITSFGAQPGGVSNDGINIQARAGTPVKATAAGTVVHVGDQLQGYGKLVIIRHENGWLSAYAHNAETFVKKNQKVNQGQTISSVGASGKVTEPQLHFSLRQGKDPRNPLTVLEQTTTADAKGQSQQL